MTEKDLPMEVLQSLDKFDEKLASLEYATSVLSNVDTKTDTSRLNPLEKAHLNFTLAYSMNSAFHLFLKVNGVDPNGHPVREQLQRTQKYAKKIDRVENPDKYKRQQELSKAAISIVSLNPKTEKPDSEPSKKRRKTSKKTRKSS